MRTDQGRCRLTMADGTDPQLKILRSVVVADAVLVVHRLTFAQRPAQSRLHDEAMLGYKLATFSSNHDVAGSRRPPLSISSSAGGHGLPHHLAPMCGAVGHYRLAGHAACSPTTDPDGAGLAAWALARAVSYTHLTLPTKA